jgi:hypothetical protein
LVFWIGLHPAPFTRVLDKTVQHLLQQTHRPSSVTTAMRPSPFAPRPSDLGFRVSDLTPPAVANRP